MIDPAEDDRIDVSEAERRRMTDQVELRHEKLRALRAMPHPFGCTTVEPATALRWIDRGGASE
jgi:hypothetical protein